VVKNFVLRAQPSDWSNTPDEGPIKNIKAPNKDTTNTPNTKKSPHLKLNFSLDASLVI
jgi:hypothetical protein